MKRTPTAIRPDIENALVRYSRAGDAFHYRWAARRCLKLVDLKSNLDYITIESSSENKAAGEYIIDMAEYSHNEAGDKLVNYRQLKHSTIRTDKPFGYSEIKRTLSGFAQRYAACFCSRKSEYCKGNVVFTFVSNRPVSTKIKQALNRICEDLPAKNKLQRDLQRLMKLKEAHLRIFCKSLKFMDSEGDYIAQKRMLHGEMEQYIAGFVESGEVEQLIALVANRALPQSESRKKPGEISREDVLQRLGATSHTQLFPAPPEFEKLPRIIKRKQHAALLQHIQEHIEPTIVHAAGGIGKSIMAQQLAETLPPGSIGIVYDCFGGGKYRNQSEPRHRAQDALVQMANELATHGLCQPLLCRQGTQSDALFRSFKERLQQAVEKLHEVNKAAMLVLLIDAADNAEMAAIEYNDKCFAKPLLLESLPQGSRLVMFCRSERIDHLAPPNFVHKFPLNGFSLNESGAHLRQHFLDASEHDISEFHRLSGGNPRVQAYALNSSGQNLAAVLSALGPTKTTVDDQIYDQLQVAVASLQDRVGPNYKQQVDDICKGLANLPPFIPLEVLATAAAVNASAIKSFISDLGRPLWHSDDSVQFRDEPTEFWFRKTFATDKTQIATYVSLLEPLAKKFPYVAKVLPQLLLRSGNYPKLVDLALSNDFLPENSPIDARNIQVYRLQYAFKAALKLNRLADATRLAFRAGEEVAGNQRQLELLQDHLDLIAPLQDVSRVEELAHRQVFEGDWPGSQNLYSAALLSSTKDFHGEARSFLRAAGKWLQIHFETREQFKFDHPEQRHFNEQLTVVQISEFIWTHYNLYGVEAAVKYILTWKPPMVIFQATRLFVSRLVTAAKFDEIDGIAELGAENPHLILALTDELAETTKFPPIQCLQTTLDFLNDPKTRLPKSNSISFDNPMPSAILSVAEACAAQGLAKHKILGVLEYYWERKAHRAVSSRFNNNERKLFFRVAALKAVLQGNYTLNPQTLLPERDPKQKNTNPPDREDAELIQVVLAFLPIYIIRARFIVRDPTTNEIDLRKAFETTESDLDRGYYGIDRQINYEAGAAYFDSLALKQSVTSAELDTFATHVARRTNPKLTLDDSLHATFVAYRMPHLAALRSHLEQNCSAALQAPGTDGPETQAGLYIRLARAVLPISRADARAYFNRAVEAVSKFGDEMVERWQAIVAVAKQAGKTTKPLSTLCYRFIRCGEMVGETVAREKYWNRNEVFRTAVHLDASGTFAALSRWRDRYVGYFGDQLEALATEAVNSHILSTSIGWSLSAFAGCNASTRLATTCIEHECAPARRQYFFDVAIHDNKLKGAHREDWKVLSELSGKFNLHPGNIAEWAASATSEYEFHSPPTYIGTPSTQLHEKAEVARLDKIFENSNLLIPSSLNAVVAAFRQEQPFSLKFDFWQQVLSRVSVGSEVDFLQTLVANDGFDFYDLERAVAAIAKVWSDKAGVKDHWSLFLKRIGRRFASHFVTDYHTTSWIVNGSINETDAEIVRTAAFDAFADSPEMVDASTFFGFVHQFSKRLTQVESEQLLQFALDRFELHVPKDFADGEWLPWLQTPSDPSEGVTGFIWSALGSPDSKYRWEAAHCVRRLAENSCRHELDCLVDWMAKGKTGAFGHQKFPFYDLDAKLYLLIALARVAVDNPTCIKHHAKFFAEIALNSLPHLLIQIVSSDIALRIEAVHPSTYDASTRAKLKKIGKSPFLAKVVRANQDGISTPWHKAGQIDHDLKVHFSHDFDRHSFEPLGHFFGVSQKQVIELARQIAVDELKIPQGDEYLRDPRQEVWNQIERPGSRSTWANHGNHPLIENYIFYYSYHSLMITAARLISRMPVLHETRYSYREDELQAWLDRHLIVRQDGRWLADRRDPPPLKRRDWIKKGTGKDWVWELNADDFFDCMCEQGPVPGFLCVQGSWNDHSGSFEEDITVSSALVHPNSATALAMAMRTSDDPWGLTFIDYPYHDMDFTKAPFQLTPWLRYPGEYSSQLDAFDPYTRKIPYPAHAVKPKFATKLNLVTDVEGRLWRKSDEKIPVLISEVWSDWEQPISSDWEDPFRSGSRISASPRVLKELCSRTSQSLILSVHIQRRHRQRHHFSDEHDLGYIPPSHKIFIYSSNGKLYDTTKNYQLG